MRAFQTQGLILAKFQARLFEKSATRFDCSSGIFLRRFSRSEVRKMLDRNDPVSLSMTVDEALDDIESEFGVTSYGKTKYSPDALFWMGYMYRYISYTRDMETPLLMKLIPHEQLADVYYVYHTQDPEWCVANLLELNSLTEDIFDRNWRLKQVMIRHGKLVCSS